MDVLIINSTNDQASSKSSKPLSSMITRISFLLLPHLRWWVRKYMTTPFQCLTWSSLRLHPWSMVLLLRHAPPLALQLQATAILTRKNSHSKPLPKAAHSKSRSVNVNPSSIPNLLPLKHLREEMSNRKTLGSVRSRPNCVGSGCKAFNARTKWRSRDAVSRMARKNSRRKRL